MQVHKNNNTLKDFIICIHNTKGRLRFRLTALGIKILKHFNGKKRDEVLRRIENITGITNIKLNPTIASITLLYDTQLTDEPTVMSSLTSIVNETFFNKKEKKNGC